MNHAAAWTALADRFADAATRCDFDLWSYSILHPTDPVVFRTLRRVWHTDSLPFATDHTALAVRGRSTTLAPEEFLQLNRFDWLGWAAGTLLRPNSDRPHRDWLLHVYRESGDRIERQDGQGLLRDAVARSAEVARRLAGETRPVDRRFVPPAAGAWQLPFESLRATFDDYARGVPLFELEFYATSAEMLLLNDARLNQRFEADARAGRTPEMQQSNTHSLYADTRCFKLFTDMAAQAGRALPPALKPPARLFADAASRFPEDRNPDPFADWCVFLWAASPDSFRPYLAGSDEYGRMARWEGGNPFLASVLAIDQFVRGYTAETAPLFTRRLAEVCPWLTHEDRPAVNAAIEAAYREPPLPPAAPASGPPTMADILQLLAYRRTYPEFERRMHELFPHVMSPGEGYNMMCYSALNCPDRGRLDEDGVAQLRVYRRLMATARRDYHTELDEATFRCVVADAADAIGITFATALATGADEFQVRWDAATAAVTAAAVLPIPITQPPTSHIELTERLQGLLVEMLAMGAVRHRDRVKQADVVGRLNAGDSPDNYKRDFARLGELRLTDSGAGRNGGVWLTALSRATAERLSPR